MKTKTLFIIMLFLSTIGTSKATTINIDICSGDTIPIGGTVYGGQFYYWNLVPSTPSIMVSPIVNTQYVRIVLDSAFQLVLKDTFNIIVKPLPIISIVSIGGNTICMGMGSTLQLIANSMPLSLDSYTWSNGSITPDITVGPNVNTTYTVTGSLNGCHNSASFPVMVQAPPSAYQITGNTNYCQNLPGVMMGLAGSESDCWYALYHNNQQVDSALGTGGAISFGMIANANGIYTAKGFKNNLGCPANMLGYLQVSPDPLPAAADTIIGQTTVCQYDTLMFVTPIIANATSYTWAVPNGATIISGQGTTQVHVAFNGVMNGMISVSGQNSCGGGQLSSRAITINSAPTPAITANPAIICMGNTSTLSVDSGTVFVWSTGYNTQVTIVSPSTTTTYYVTVTGSNTCTAHGSVTVTIVPQPNVSLNLMENSFCTSTNSAVLSGGLPIGGTYSGICVFNNNMVYPPVSGVGTYLVTYAYIDGNGCDNSATDLLTVNPIPLVNFNNVMGPLFIDTPPFDLMGYVDQSGGTFVGPGVMSGSSIFNPLLAGTGSHMITYTYIHPSTGCSASQIQYMNVGALGIYDIFSAVNALCIFPNPATIDVAISGLHPSYIKTIRIIDMVTGSILYSTEVTNEKVNINISNFSAGTYIISFTNIEGISINKTFMKK